MDYGLLASQIIEKVGGKENIADAFHCLTRLRLILKDPSKADTAAVESLKGVLSVVEQGGQYQVVIGNEVKDVCKEVIVQTGLEAKDASPAKPEEIKNPILNVLKVITSTMTPVINILGAAGVLKGFLSLLSTIGLVAADSGAYLMLNALGDSMFYFFPIILGFTAGKRLGCTPYIPAVIGGALVYPSVVAAVGGEPLSFFGIPWVLMNYTSTVFPIIIAAWLCSLVEPRINKVLPASAAGVLTPFFTILLVGVATFLAVGPAATLVANALVSVVFAVYDFSAILSGALLGAFFQLAVVFGLHWGLIAVLITSIAANGQEPLIFMIGISMLAQTGVALGIALKSRGELRDYSIAACVTSLFGITEPILYGLTLKYRRALVISLVMGGITGAVAGLMGVSFYGTAGGIFGFVSSISPNGIDVSFYGYCVAFLIAVFGTAAVIYFLGYEGKDEHAVEAAK